jgi:hypothetical protein
MKAYWGSGGIAPRILWPNFNLYTDVFAKQMWSLFLSSLNTEIYVGSGEPKRQVPPNLNLFCYPNSMTFVR